MINYNNDTDDDDFERSMDEFLEKVASIDSCYNNGYKLITNKRTLAELTEEKLVVMPLEEVDHRRMRISL